MTRGLCFSGDGKDDYCMDYICAFREGRVE